jgi:hypothetical protein
MNTLLITNMAFYVLMIAALAVVPLLPGMIMKRILGAGLAQQRAADRSIASAVR